MPTPSNRPPPQELVEAYPDAKVILTVRDFDRWYDSAAATIYRISEATAPLVRPPVWLVARLPRWLLPLVGSAQRAMADALVWRGTFQGRFKDREFTRQVGRGGAREDDTVRQGFTRPIAYRLGEAQYRRRT